MLVLNGCFSDKSDESIQEIDLSKMMTKEEAYFHLDEQSTFSNLYVKYFDDGITDYFSFLNEINNNIYVYKYSDPEIYKKISIAKELGRIIGYDFIDDSLVSIITHKNIICKFNIHNNNTSIVSFSKDAKKPYSSHIRTSHSFFHVSEKYYWPNVILGHNMNNLINTFELSHSDIVQKMNYPNYIKNSNKILFENFYEFYYVYDSLMEKFIFSFPFSDSLIITDLELNNSSTIQAGSSLIDIKPVFNRNWSNKEKVMRLRFHTPYYYAIIPDNYRNVYYRMLVNPVYSSSADLSKLDFHDKPINVLVFDNQFIKLSEKRLEENKYAAYIYFVSRKGLNICNREKSIDDESTIYFDVF